MTSTIVDQRGKPFPRTATVRASFDLAKTNAHNRRHWANADSLSARAAMSPAVRALVRQRSRYEFDNNSWYSGILRTAANHIIGCGPRLQVLTTDADANTRLEKAWMKWSRQVMLADKLRMMFETYWKDGEVFAMRTSRPSRWPISLDLRTFEAEQCAAPWFGHRLSDPYVDDGVRTDPNNNEVEYHFYRHHPGDVAFTPALKGDWFPASEVVHLWRRERPGHVRGIPRATSALNTLPVMRRQEMATLLAAETSASIATFLKSTGAAVTPALCPQDFAELEIAFNMLTMLPEDWEIDQVDSKHPGPQYESFQRHALTSFCRCTNMPYALAAGTSRDSNFSSNKGDVKNVWEPETKTEQDRIELSVIEPIWSWFLEDAVYVAGLLDGLPSNDDIDHKWTWSPLPNLDEVDSATAAKIRLKTGQSTAKTVDDVGTAVVSGEITANVTKILGTTIVETSAGNIAANFDNFFDNGDSLTSAVVDDVGTATVAANLTQILGTAITETTAGRLAGNVETFFENGDSATSKTVDDVGTAVVGGEISANLTKVLGTAISESTAGNIAANVETFFDNADGLTVKTVDDVGTATVSGEVTANVTKFLGTTIVETTAGNIAKNFDEFFDNDDALTIKTVDDVGAVSGEVTANLTKVLGTAISESTAGNIASNVETFFDNADGLTTKTVDDVGTVTGDVTANVTKILGTTLVETTSGNIAANFDEFFDNGDGLTTRTVDDVGGGSGAGGANAVTITITDDAGTPVPLETAVVRVTGAGVDETLSTDAAGEAIFALDDATYTVTITMGSYNGRVESLVVSGVTAQTWQLTPNSPATPAAPGLSTGTGIVYDNLMQPEGGVPVSFQMTSGPGTAGRVLNKEPFTVVSADGTGGTTLGEISSNKFLQGATYSKWRGAAAGTPAASEFAVRSGVSYESMVVPLASTFMIPETIGKDA